LVEFLYYSPVPAWVDAWHDARLNLAILCDLYLADTTCARDNYLAYQRLVPGDQRVESWIADLNARAKP
jgi:hypothetical protein